MPFGRHHRHQKAEFWSDMGELHRVMHQLPDYFKGVLLELLAEPMSREEIEAYARRLETRMVGTRRIRGREIDVERDINLAIGLSVLEEKTGRFVLTPGGREIAEHMQEVIPLFMGYALSPNVVSTVTIVVHILLTIAKLSFGLISQSAGLIADGIDNGVDTVSAVLVWMGIRSNRERLASLIVVVMMFVSVGGIALASYAKIVHPGPVREGLAAFVVSALCGLLMLLLSAYQYAVGKRSSNLAILCQSIDSRNHLLTSVLVCGVILLSFLATRWHATWLYYGDAGASIVIACLILKGAIELSMEIVRRDTEPTHISHFMKTAMEKRRARMIWTWLSEQLREDRLTGKELERRFSEEFCEQAPRILVLSGMGYRPESSGDLRPYLDRFVREKKLDFTGDTYGRRVKA